MITIAIAAVLLALLKPAARLYRDTSPEIARILDRLASIDTAIVLFCMIIGVYVTVRLMAEDEKA
jgi:hypothetical protein